MNATLNLEGASEEQLAEHEESLRKLLNHIEGKKQNARDDELVWVMNPSGRPDVCRRGLWRTHLSRQSEKGWRLLEPDEIDDQQAKAEQARIVREEKQRLWSRLSPRDRTNREGVSDRAGWQEYSVNELREMVEESGGSSGPRDAAELRKKVEVLEERLAELTDD